jgi:hypothetical protein
VADLIAGFDDYVDRYDREVPFQRSGQYRLHRHTIERRRLHRSVVDAIADDEFTRLLHESLQAWGIGKRASVLVPSAQFRQVLAAAAADLRRLDDVVLDQSATGVVDDLWALVDGLAVVDNVSRIVPGTKTLHHLLPDLVPPMDRAWTGRFFEWNAAHLQQNQQRTFGEAWVHLCHIADETAPERLVGAGWRTSRTKVVDNAIVAYGMR